MFKVFTFKSFASLAVMTAVACIGSTDVALAKRKKLQVDGAQYETSRVKVRDHRKQQGGVTVTVSDSERNKPEIRDHRRKAKKDLWPFR